MGEYIIIKTNLNESKIYKKIFYDNILDTTKVEFKGNKYELVSVYDEYNEQYDVNTLEDGSIYLINIRPYDKVKYIFSYNIIGENMCFSHKTTHRNYENVYYSVRITVITKNKVFNGFGYFLEC